MSRNGELFLENGSLCGVLGHSNRLRSILPRGDDGRHGSRGSLLDRWLSHP